MQDAFGGTITGIRVQFGEKYKIPDWQIHEQILAFREELKDLKGVELKATPGGRVNVSFSGEAYVRRSI